MNQHTGDLDDCPEDIRELLREFHRASNPLETVNINLLSDARTNSHFCECHIKASNLVALGTIDVPLDPDEQSDYRANRELDEDHAAFEKMREDALNKRSFSNIVVEYSDTHDPEHPIKIIGGQHRFKAIEEALDSGVDEYHGVKVYFCLDPDQRLDVQVISNTNIAVSSDLLDRMIETVSGPQLRTWCQTVGLLDEEQDFADKGKRGQPITVRAARTFIINYYMGKKIDPKSFDDDKTTPVLAKTGTDSSDWSTVKVENSDLWSD